MEGTKGLAIGQSGLNRKLWSIHRAFVELKSQSSQEDYYFFQRRKKKCC